MTHKALSKSDREGISLRKLFKMFPDDNAARAWFAKHLWPNGPHCPKCGSFDVQLNAKHKTMTHRCRVCPGKPFFSLRTGTAMQNSKLGYQIWAIAIYMIATNLKGVSSMKLHRDLEITQSSAWHLAHRIRKSFADFRPIFFGPLEADEAYMGGKEGNKHAKKKLHAGRGAVGKTPVAGIKDRKTGLVKAEVVQATDAKTLQGFVRANSIEGAKVHTDDSSAYKGMVLITRRSNIRSVNT